MITPSPPDTAAERGLKHAIGWCDLTFNYGIYGCAMVSPACGTADGSSMCYASKTAERLTAFAHGGGPYAGLVEDGRWTGEVRIDPARIGPAFASLPKRPRRDGRPWRVFGSMFDLFHKDVPFEFIAIVYGAMAARPWINFQILTKRADRMAEFYRWLGRNGQDEWETIINAADAHDGDGHEPALLGGGLYVGQWPIPNIWAGVTVEDQKRADERIPWLLRVPAAVRFLSVEPMLGAIDISRWCGYYPLHEASESRGHPTFVGAGRMDRGEAGRVDLACSAATEESVGRHAGGGSGQSSQDRCSGGGRVSDREGHGGRSPDVRSGTPAGVEGHAWTDPAWDDHQPQEWRQVGQSTGEPRTGHLFGELTPRSSCAARRPGAHPERGGEHERKVDRADGAGDPPSPTGGREPQRFVGCLRGEVSDDFQDRAGQKLAIHQVIIGSESDGPRPGARETRHEWIESLVEQCDAAGVPVFVKQVAIDGRLCALPEVNGRVRAEFPG